MSDLAAVPQGRPSAADEGGASATASEVLARCTPPGGQPLELWPQKAAFDPALSLLLVADAHLGKAVSFRRWGVPVPEPTTQATLARLDRLVQATGARQLVFLGDLLHSARAASPSLRQAVAAWRQRHASLAITLVRGNHDDRAGDPPPDWGIEVRDGPLRRGPWALMHEAEPVAGAYALGGHLHPCITLAGRGGDRLRLACFHFEAEVGVLPAFGEFTGMHAIRPTPRGACYAVVDRQVVALRPPRAPD